MALPSPLPINNERALGVVICAILFPILATLTVIARVAARWMNKAKYGLDDFFCFLALIAVYGQMMIVVLSVYYGGVGHHIEELDVAHILTFYKLLSGLLFPSALSLGFAKISICFLLIRIFSVKDTFRKLAWGVMIYQVLFTLTTLLIASFLCRPFNFNWDKNIKGTCGNQTAAYISISALDIFGDVLIIALPMPWLWQLKISNWSKVGLSLVFAMGVVDIVAACLRIVYLLQISFVFPADTMWEASYAYLWSLIEPCLGVIVACAGILRPVFLYFSSVVKSLNLTSRTKGQKYSKYKEKGQLGSDDTDFALKPINTIENQRTDGKSGGAHVVSGNSEKKANKGKYGEVTVTDSEYALDMTTVRGNEELGTISEMDPKAINVENSYTVESVYRSGRNF